MPQTAEPAGPPPRGIERSSLPLLAAAACVGALIHLPNASIPALTADEASFSALGARLADTGTLPYIGGAEPRGPLYYGLAWLLAVVAGPYSTAGLRCALGLLTVLNGWLIARWTETVGGRAAAWASLAAYGLLLMIHPQFQSMIPEAVTTPLLTGGMLAWAPREGAPSRRRRRLGAVLFGLALLIKQTAGAALLVLAWMIWERGAGGKGERARGLLAGLGLALAPWLACVLLYAAAGSLSDFWYGFFLAPLDVSWGERGPEGRHFSDLARTALNCSVACPAVFILSVAGTGVALAARRGGGEDGSLASSADIPFVLGLLCAKGLVTYFTGWAPHSYLFALVFPELALLAGLGASELWRRARRPQTGRAWALGLGAALAILTAYHTVYRTWIRPRRAGWTQVVREPAHFQPVLQAMSRGAASPETLFVWGDQPQLYVLSRRIAATRFAQIHEALPAVHRVSAAEAAGVTRFVTRPESWRQLREELQRAPPAFIIDGSQSTPWLRPYPFAGVSELGDWLAANYRPVEVAGDFRLYERAPSGARPGQR